MDMSMMTADRRSWPMNLGARLSAGLAGGLVAVAALLAEVNGDSDIVPFFVGLTVAAGIHVWAVGAPFGGLRRRVAWTIVALWLLAAIWIGGLLVMYQAMCACSRPFPAEDITYLGLTATVYHLTGLYGGLLLAIVAASLAERARTNRSTAAGAG
jgi:membrane associated rhomboid family serine protease